MAAKNKGWSRGRDEMRRSLMLEEFSSFPFSPSWAWQALLDPQGQRSNSYQFLLLQHLRRPWHLVAALVCCTPLAGFLPCCMLLSVKPSLQRLREPHIPSNLKLNIMDVLQALLPLRLNHIWCDAKSLFFPSTSVISASARIWAHSGMGST